MDNLKRANATILESSKSIAIAIFSKSFSLRIFYDVLKPFNLQQIVILFIWIKQVPCPGVRLMPDSNTTEACRFLGLSNGTVINQEPGEWNNFYNICILDSSNDKSSCKNWDVSMSLLKFYGLSKISYSFKPF